MRGLDYKILCENALQFYKIYNAEITRHKRISGGIDKILKSFIIYAFCHTVLKNLIICDSNMNKAIIIINHPCVIHLFINFKILSVKGRLSVINYA